MIKAVFSVLLLFSLFACSKLPEKLDQQNISNSIEETPQRIIVKSANVSPTMGFVFYPGGLVDAHAYLKWQDDLVTKHPQLMIVTVKMPSNLAVLGFERGLQVLKDYPNISTWVAGGHSLGGTMTASLIATNKEKFKAQIFIASYPADDKLKDWNGAVLSIYGEKDGLSTPAIIDENKINLPTPYSMKDSLDFSPIVQSNTSYYQMKGANHAQFGNYGSQEKDGTATISAAEQQKQLVDLIDAFLNLL